jgi:hypothetical protein
MGRGEKDLKGFEISLGVLAVGIWSILVISKNPSMVDMREIKSKLESTGKFRSTSVMDNTFKNNSFTTHSIIVESHVDGPLSQTKEDLKPYYDLAFQAIRDQIKDLSQYNNLRVGLRVGYDIGIRKRYHTWFQDENPANPGQRKDSGSRSNF